MLELLNSLNGPDGQVQGDKIALTNGQRSLSYSELVNKVATLAAWIDQQKPSVVALHAQNDVDWVLIDLACKQAAVICLPLPDFFSLSQLEYCLVETQVELLFSNSNALLTRLDQAGYVHHAISNATAFNAVKLHLKQPAPLSNCPLGTQKITFTSGSTGTPKGVCLSAEHQWQTAQALVEALQLESPRHLCLLPLATLLENIAGVYAPLLNGGTVIVPGDAERGLSGSAGLDIPKFLDCISQHQPHSIILLPQLLSVLVAACEQGWSPPSSLQFIAVGGARVAAELVESAHRHDLPVYEGYGLSECGSVVTLNTPAHNRAGQVGRALGHCNVKLDESEIVVTGSVFLGYLAEPGSWYPKQVRTGDLGSMQDDFLLVSGRKKNLIITSFGRNISPEWVESELAAKPLLAHCVVIGDGQPHLVALLSAPEHISNTLIDHWINSVNSSLPDYAQVKAWKRLAMEQWPALLTANGRPQRQTISHLMADTIAELYCPTSISIARINPQRLSANQRMPQT